MNNCRAVAPRDSYIFWIEVGCDSSSLTSPPLYPPPHLPTTHSIFILFFHAWLNASLSELPANTLWIHRIMALSRNVNFMPEALSQVMRTYQLLPSFPGILPVVRVSNSGVPKQSFGSPTVPGIYKSLKKTSDISNNAYEHLDLFNNGRKHL